MSGAVDEQPGRLAERSDGRGPFERFAGRATTLVSGAIFFVACVALVLVWLATFSCSATRTHGSS
jgi:hypothetical protein